MFYFVAAVSIAVITVFVCWACYRLVKTLTGADKIIKEINGVVEQIEIFKGGLKIGLITLVTALVEKLSLVSRKPKEVKGNEE